MTLVYAFCPPVLAWLASTSKSIWNLGTLDLEYPIGIENTLCSIIPANRSVWNHQSLGLWIVSFLLALVVCDPFSDIFLSAVLQSRPFPGFIWECYPGREYKQWRQFALGAKPNIISLRVQWTPFILRRLPDLLLNTSNTPPFILLPNLSIYTLSESLSMIYMYTPFFNASQLIGLIPK